MRQEHYHPGKIWPIIKITLGLIKKNPDLLNNEDYLKSTLKANIAELNNPERCPNCQASMLEYIYEFDILDALLLLEMAKEIKRKVQGGIPFTEANKIHIQQLNLATYAMKSRTTKMSKLGFIAKLLGENKRQISGTWVVTKRGWDALRGRKVPKSVRVWRGNIEDRIEDLTTIGEVFSSHRVKVESIIKKKKTPATDYRGLFSDYEQKQWYDIGGVHDGKLF
jgi:hypothetical protein